MGRLFWKFFVCILLAQLTATVGIGGAIWLKNRSTQNIQTADLDTSPPAEMAINSAAATLEYGGVKALRTMLEHMNRRRAYAVDEQGKELLGRSVTPAMLGEARFLLLKQDRQRPAVRQVTDPQGKRYMLFLPTSERSYGFGLEGGSHPLLSSLGETRFDMGMPRHGYYRSLGPGGYDAKYGPRSLNGQPVPPHEGGPGGASAPGPLGQPGAPDGRGGPGADGPGGPGDHGPMGGAGPRFQPMAPWVPIAAAVLASLLFSVLLAWYFSRPIRSLRQAFEAAAGGDLAPRFSNSSGNSSGKRGTELNDLGRDFDRMTARLRSLMDGQTRLLHDVSHELRSPLARLQAAIGLAHQQPDKLAASMERIERESVRMDKLVGELLTLARLEAGALNTMREEVSMADLLEQIADDASYEASSQRRRVVCEGVMRDREGDVQVIGQADLLASAIENVVRNAIKHSPEGGSVTLQVCARAEARQLVVRVLDNGPGVAPADLETIFQPFFRSSNADAEGHGLGLAIAQQVVQAHGGSIKASNRPEGGLCVEIILPVAQQRAAAQA